MESHWVLITLLSFSNVFRYKNNTNLTETGQYEETNIDMAT